MNTDKEVEKHVRTGELEQVGYLEFQCKICEVPLGQQPMAHIKGSQHKNKVFWVIMREPVSFGELYNALPSELREANSSGIIQVGEMTVSCTVCNTALSGEKPLMDHLLSSNHKKKLYSKGIPSAVVKIPEVKAPSTPQKVDISIPRVVHNYPPTAGAIPKQQEVPIPSVISYDKPSAPVNVDTSSPGIEALEAAKKRGFIKARGDHFTCLICNVDMTGDAPLQQHLKGAKHLKKEMNFQSQQGQRPQPILSNLHQSSTMDHSMHININIISAMDHQNQNFDAQKYSTQQSKTPDCSQQMSAMSLWPSLPAKPDEKSTSSPGIETPWKLAVDGHMQHAEARPLNTYPIRSRPRGVVAIFNYTFPDDDEWRRDGATHDSVNLKKVFEEMDYTVHLYEEYTRQQTLDQIEAIKPVLRKVDCFLLFFLSHGVNEQEFHTAEKATIRVPDIWLLLNNANCPSMKGKPKLLFCNYCRGEKRQTIHYDNVGIPADEAPADLAIVQATLQGFKACRRPDSGTFFVQSLCETLQKYARSKDLQDIVYETSRKMQEKGGTTATVENVDFGKKFYFLD